MRDSVYFVINRVSGAFMTKTCFEKLGDAEEWFKFAKMNKKIHEIKECIIREKKK